MIATNTAADRHLFFAAAVTAASDRASEGRLADAINFLAAIRRYFGGSPATEATEARLLRASSRPNAPLGDLAKPTDRRPN